MLQPIVLFGLLTAGGDSPAVRVAASLPAESLEVSGRYSIVVEVEMPEGASSVATGWRADPPAPFLQIDVPPSIRLVGEPLTTYAELASNEFVAEPFERLLRELPARVEFELIAEPGADEVIGLNLIGYIRSEEEEMFMRRRLELPVRAKAVAEEVSATDSSWSCDERLLQIGDDAAPFVLPLGDGTEVALADFIGEKNIIVTTYRAHW